MRSRNIISKKYHYIIQPTIDFERGISTLHRVQYITDIMAGTAIEV
jgi:hypothetical protein